MPGGVEPVGHWEAQVVTVKFDEGGPQFGCAVQRLGEGVGLELKAPTQPGHAEGQQLQGEERYMIKVN